ncbi:MAG: benzoate-CoA ligase family protein [Hyphomicrobiales bacterium]|nr:benzoate-CoA ligase family protein [Hyphomicrobiales bacterium]
MIKGEDIDFPLPERLNLGAYFLDINLELGRADKPAIFYKGGCLSFLDLWRLTNRIGNILRDLGTEPENRVLLILEDSPEWVATWLATLKIGAVGTHAYTYLDAPAYTHLLKLVRPKVVVVDAKVLPKLRQASVDLRYPRTFLVAGEIPRDLRPNERSLPGALETASDSLEIEDTHRDDIAFWNFSSGTTGMPKGTPHMHRDILFSYESLNYVLKYRPDDVFLRVPKLFFHYARDMGCLFPLRSGASVILFEERTTAPLIFDLIRKHRPTVLINVPTMMRAMIQTPPKERADLSCLRLNMSSGERLSAELYHRWIETFGVEVTDRFGSAESSIGYLCNRPGAVVPGSAGTVAPLAEIKLVDDSGREVEKGQPGILMARSDASAQYYVREHEKSKVTFPGDDWVNTGDLFRQDADDRFWYVGRVDDMVKVGGVWVSPVEIEHSLHGYPGVSECAALGVQGDDGLIQIEAFVAFRPGAASTAATPADLKQFCKSQLGPHKAPGAVFIMDELPKTGQGKIDRQRLRALAREACV